MTSTPPLDTTPRQLLRSRSQRLIAGVAGGIGRYLRVDPVVVRLVFVALTIVGGLGALLYLTAWLIVPEEAPDPARADDEHERSSRYTWLLVAGLALIVLFGGIRNIGWGFGSSLVWPLVLICIAGAVLWVRRGDPQVAAEPVTPWPTVATSPVPGPTVAARTVHEPTVDTAPTGEDPFTAAADTASRTAEMPRPRREHPVVRRVAPAICRLFLVLFIFAATLAVATAAVVLVEGADAFDVTTLEAFLIGGLATGLAVWLGIVTHRWPELIAAVLAIVLVCAVAAWLRPPLRGGYGTRDLRPTSAAALSDTYRLAGGRLRVDLSGVTLPAHSTQVAAEVGAGLLQIVVPRDAKVVLDAHVGAGALCAFGRRDTGAAIRRVATTPVGTRVLHLHPSVGAGAIVIARNATGLGRACR